MKKIAACLLLLISTGLQAQHMHSDSTKEGMEMGPMCHSFSLNLPMSRNGSGTGWLPDASPMYGHMIHGGPWMFMLHYNVFLRYTHQDLSGKGSRGDEKWDAPNWIMFMGQRKVGMHGLFHFETMLSLDPVTEGGAGYPLLFQTGETWDGKPLVDRQHPHDLISGLSVGYSQAFGKKTDVFVYFGYPGEPALGSVVFMHRPSALPNPDAPIGHHWNDATHITFGVATLGVRYGKFKLEGSSFTGREPDENRYDFDEPKFDSWSGRLSFSPTVNWTLQVSHAFVNSPEVLHPEEDIRRSTASVNYSHTMGERSFSSTVLWGLNQQDPGDENTVLAEGAYAAGRWQFWLRYEWIQKSGEELDLATDGYGPHALFPIHAGTVGAAFDVLHAEVNVAIGGQFSLYEADDRLDRLYGNNPVSAEAFIRIYPSRM